MSKRGWQVLSAVLLVFWIFCAVLEIGGHPTGFLTNHGADIAVPAWMYIIARSPDHPRRRTFLRRTLGRTPEFAAVALFVASTATEISQRYWPRGLFAGTYDPWDIVAFASGLAVCYVLDRRTPPEEPLRVHRA